MTGPCRCASFFLSTLCGSATQDFPQNRFPCSPCLVAQWHQPWDQYTANKQATERAAFDGSIRQTSYHNEDSVFSGPSRFRRHLTEEWHQLFGFPRSLTGVLDLSSVPYERELASLRLPCVRRCLWSRSRLDRCVVMPVPCVGAAASHTLSSLSGQVQDPTDLEGTCSKEHAMSGVNGLAFEKQPGSHAATFGFPRFVPNGFSPQEYLTQAPQFTVQPSLSWPWPRVSTFPAALTSHTWTTSVDSIASSQAEAILADGPCRTQTRSERLL